MKPRENFGKIRVGIALSLFFALALVRLIHPNEGMVKGQVAELPNKALPGSCAIIATEAYHRIAAAAAWTRLLHIEVNDGQNIIGHMVVVWQASDNSQTLAYDTYLWTGTTELGITPRDAVAVAFALSRRFNRVQVGGAHFI